jgi:hypothetical protein
LTGNAWRRLLFSDGFNSAIGYLSMSRYGRRPQPFRAALGRS